MNNLLNLISHRLFNRKNPKMYMLAFGEETTTSKKIHFDRQIKLMRRKEN